MSVNVPLIPEWNSSMNAYLNFLSVMDWGFGNFFVKCLSGRVKIEAGR